jgi:hypothetical protein
VCVVHRAGSHVGRFARNKFSPNPDVASFVKVSSVFAVFFASSDPNSSSIAPLDWPGAPATLQLV